MGAENSSIQAVMCVCGCVWLTVAGRGNGGTAGGGGATTERMNDKRIHAIHEFVHMSAAWHPCKVLESTHNCYPPRSSLLNAQQEAASGSSRDYCMMTVKARVPAQLQGSLYRSCSCSCVAGGTWYGWIHCRRSVGTVSMDHR
jgi:hypothetical protein